MPTLKAPSKLKGVISERYMGARPIKVEKRKSNVIELCI